MCVRATDGFRVFGCFVLAFARGCISIRVRICRCGCVEVFLCVRICVRPYVDAFVCLDVNVCVSSSVLFCVAIRGEMGFVLLCVCISARVCFCVCIESMCRFVVERGNEI